MSEKESKHTRFFRNQMIVGVVGIAIALVWFAIKDSDNATASDPPLPNPHDFISPDEFCWKAGYDWSLGSREVYRGVIQWLCIDKDNERQLKKITYNANGSGEPWQESEEIARSWLLDYFWIRRTGNHNSLSPEMSDFCTGEDNYPEVIFPTMLQTHDTRFDIADGIIVCAEEGDLVVYNFGNGRELDRIKDVKPVPREVRMGLYERNEYLKGRETLPPVN